MKNINAIVEFISQVEKEYNKELTETQIRQVFSMLVEKIEKLKGGKGFAVKSKGGKLLGKHKSRNKALKQLAAVEISKKRRGK